MIYQQTISVFFCVALLVGVNNLEPKWNVWSMAEYNYGATTKDLSSYSITKSIPKEIIAARLTSNEGPFDSLLLVGDVMLARNVEMLMRQHGSAYPFQGIDFLRHASNPAVIGNFEASIPEQHRFTPVNGLRFSVSVSYLDSLHQAGFTHLSLANNHTSDFGSAGFQHTVNTLEGGDFEVFGHPTTITRESFTVVEVGGTRVALIGLHTLHSEPTIQDLEYVFTQAKKLSELQVVFIHWGEEYELTHNNAQRHLAEQLVALGADVIVGHHPHVVQGVERIDGVPVFYSLGNYIFDQYFSDEVQTGLMLHVEVAPEPKIHLLPVESKISWSQPRAMDTGPHQLFLRELSERSDPSLKLEINSGIIIWNNLVATSSEIAMIE